MVNLYKDLLDGFEEIAELLNHEELRNKVVEYKEEFNIQEPLNPVLAYDKKRNEDAVKKYRELAHVADDYDDWNDPYADPFTPEEEALSKELFELFQSLIDVESTDLKEKFTTKKNLENHYYKHCLADSSEKVSTQTQIFYDFRNIDKYRVYEDNISNRMRKVEETIPTLNDTALVLDNIKDLFLGNKDILFCNSCGFYNATGSVMLGVHSFSSNVTKNYSGGNTVDLIVLTSQFRTITIYPVDAYELETKLNDIIKNHSNYVGSFKFNH